MFIHTNQTLVKSFYIKKVPIFPKLPMSQRWSAIFCTKGVRGGKPIWRVRVNLAAQTILDLIYKSNTSDQQIYIDVSFYPTSDGKNMREP